MIEAFVFGVQFIFPYDRGISRVFFPSLHIFQFFNEVINIISKVSLFMF